MGLLRIGTTLGALCWASSGIAAEAGSCTDLPKSKLEVVRVYGDTTKKAVVGVGDLSEIAEKHKLLSEALEKHPLYVAPPTVTWSVSIEHRVIQQEAGFCPAPNKVTIHVGMKPRESVMVREAARIACLRKGLVRHHYEHVKAADAALGVLLPKTEATVGGALREAKGTASASEGEARAGFQAALEGVMDRVVKDLTVEVRAAEAKVDAPAALEALKACAEPKTVARNL